MAFFFKTHVLREGAFLTHSGKSFHNLGAEHENEPSNIAVLDLGSSKEPSVDDLSVHLCD